MGRPYAATGLRGVARRLGLQGPRVLRRWIAEGRLRATFPGANRTAVISEPDLRAFLADEACWPQWSPRAICDADLRAWALDLRAGVRFLDVDGVGAHCGFSGAAAAAWIVAGLVPATRTPEGWRVRESDLDGFVPPSLRDRRRPAHRPRPRPQPIAPQQLQLAVQGTLALERIAS